MKSSSLSKFQKTNKPARKRRIIDLTFPIHEGMAVFPVHWHPKVQIEAMGTFEAENRQTSRIVLGTHTGTHCDAPSHFIPGGLTIEQMPLTQYIGPALVVDFSSLGTRREITIEDFKQKLGSSRPERIIMRFDWSDHWGLPDYYTAHSFISQDTAKWLVDRGIVLLGMDTPMPDNPAHGRGSNLDSPIHKILLGNKVALVEYLCNLKSIPCPEIEFIAMPLKILRGDGAPARCAALVEET